MKNNYIYTVCNGRCGQISLANYVNTFSINTIAEGEPIEPFYKPEYVLSNFIRSLERKLYATDEFLGRGKMLIWNDNDEENHLQEMCNKRINRANKILNKNKKENYFEVSKFFIRSYGESTIKILKDLKVLYLTRDPISNAISFINRKKDFEKDNFKLDFKKNIFKVQNLDKFELYLWMWIEIKLRLLKLKEKYKFEIINYKCEDIDNLEKLSKLFDKLDIKYNSLYKLEKQNTNKSSGYEKTSKNIFFQEKFDKFKSNVPFEIAEKVPEFFNYEKY